MTGYPVTFCMLATPFGRDDTLDEAALRANVDRMVAAGNGLYLGSGGAGEGHALSRAEIARVYAVGVEQAAGRVPVYANPPEPRTAEQFVEVARLAADAGVDVVQAYQLDAGHGMRPTLAEQAAFYTTVLDRVRHPMSLSLHAGSGYLPPADLIGRLAEQFPHLCAINVIGLPPAYLVAVRDAVPERVRLFTRLADALTGLPLGASGTLSAENNLIPHLCAAVTGRWAVGDIAGAAAALADVQRLANVVNRWAPSTARWVKMGMRVLSLPGHGGGLRPPYLMPGDADLATMAEAIAAAGVLDREAACRDGAGRA